VFFTIVQAGSMAKAPEQFGVAQPTVSETIADLEDSYGLVLTRNGQAAAKSILPS
jgi:DNA-binding transcriptional LysR family regulator